LRDGEAEMNIPVMDTSTYGTYKMTVKPDYTVGRNYEQPFMMQMIGLETTNGIETIERTN